MFLTCSNPGCSSKFDYREGQLIRTPTQLDEENFGEPGKVKHFWLCGTCASQYFLEYRSGQGVIMAPRPFGRTKRDAKSAAAA